MSWVTTTNRPTRGRQRRGAVEGVVLERLRLDMQPRKPVLTIDPGEGVSDLVVQERVPRRLLLATTWLKGKRAAGVVPSTNARVQFLYRLTNAAHGGG